MKTICELWQQQNSTWSVRQKSSKNDAADDWWHLVMVWQLNSVDWMERWFVVDDRTVYQWDPKSWNFTIHKQSCNSLSMIEERTQKSTPYLPVEVFLKLSLHYLSVVQRVFLYIPFTIFWKRGRSTFREYCFNSDAIGVPSHFRAIIMTLSSTQK